MLEGRKGKGDGLVDMGGGGEKDGRWLRERWVMEEWVEMGDG